mgnify:FL=1
MIVFEHLGTKQLIGTNYKVAYTQFATRPKTFAEVKTTKCDVLLVRNPVARCLSTWKDKCRAAVNPAHVQWCQKELMRELNIDAVESLAGVSFERFVDVLPKVLLREQHFWPQLYAVDPDVVGKLHRIEDGLPDFGVDMSEQRNSTAHIPNPAITWNVLQQINGLYFIDFQLLGYKAACPRPTSPTSS